MPARSKSEQFFAAARLRIPGGVNSPVRAFRAVGGTPVFIERAAGAHLFDVDGNKYIDFVGTWGPAILGHAPPIVVEAIRLAASRGLSFGTPSPSEIEMAETLCAAVPSLEKVRMVNSGTEATMSAIRLARGFTKRDLIVKFDGCYHGHADSLLVRAGSGALTHGQPDSAGVPPQLAALTHTLPFNDPEALERTFAQVGHNVAAVIVEPLPANVGLIPPAPGFLQFLRDICSAHDALLIFDEVMTGFRLARGGMQETSGVIPDLTALGKIIGGGLPVGAFGGKAQIMDHLSPDGPVYQAGTLSGNPIAMAAGLAQLRELDRINAWEALEQSGALLESGIQAAIAKSGHHFTFHRAGSMFCLFFAPGPIRNLHDAKNADTQAFAKFFHHCLDAGIYWPPSQFETAFLSTAHSQDDILQTIDTVTSVLKKI